MPKNPPLREKHKRFCQEYIKDHNGLQSAIRAGYAPKAARQVASRLLTYANIQAYLASLHAKVERSAIMTATEVKEELSLLGRSDVADFIEVKKGNVIHVRAFDQLPAGASRCIRKIRQKVTRKVDVEDPEGGPLQEVTTEFELWNKESALDMLGRHHKVFEGKDDDPTKPTVVNITFSQAQPPKGS